MSEETPEMNDIKVEVEEPSVDTPEVVPEVVASEPEKPKRKSRKTTDEVDMAAKPKATRKKKAEKVEVVAVDLEQLAATPAAEPPAPAPTPEPQTPRVHQTDFQKVQQGMTELQAEFRRLRRESKATHYRKLLEGKI